MNVLIIMAKRALLFFFILSVSLATAQQKFTLEDAFQKYAFYPRDVHGINWMNDGKFYTSLDTDENKGEKVIARYSITSGEKVEEILRSAALPTSDEASGGFVIDDYAFNADETKILLASEEESIYRRSTRAFYYIYDLTTKKLTPINNQQKQMYASLSPKGDKVAYVVENNLFIKDIVSGEVQQVTQDGELNKIINGAADWVYEEEFSMSKAFKWSPDGAMLAYLRFDESEVKEYNMQLWGELYPVDYRFKYPKAGEKNSTVAIYVYHVEDGKTVKIDTGAETDIYLPRLYWIPVVNSVSFIKLNRLQNELELYHASPITGKANLVLKEVSNTFVDLNFTDDLTYLPDGKSFLKTSEKTGYKHIYHYAIDGSLLRPITEGEWEVDRFFGVDSKTGKLYFTSTEVSPTERHLYSVNLNGKGKKKLTSKPGMNEIEFNPDFSYFIKRRSSIKEPLQVSLHDSSGKQVKMLENNEQVVNAAKYFGFVEKELFEFSASDGTQLNGYMMKPGDFDPEKKYPVLMFVYGGPGKQTVLNEWGSMDYWWHQYLVQHGYIVVSVDNRGTDGKGVAFKHSTYGKMGKLEVEDQLRVARYLAEQKYVDRKRMGIWGWSYGGYMSSLALFLGNSVFKAGIAVAPVANWRFYDTIYTERYQNLPQNNPGGYDEYSPINHVDKLKGKYLIIHGTGDDNVHMQNSVEMINALIREGKQFESFFYPNRNHGIYGGNTRYHLYTQMSNFIFENL